MADDKIMTARDASEAAAEADEVASGPNASAAPGTSDAPNRASGHAESAADLVLRVQIPFCAQLARYQCPGGRHVLATPRLLDAYVGALEAEARATGAELLDRRVVAVHVAGDCPSLLGAERFQRLMRGLRACFALADGAEVSVDVLPGSLSAADLLAYRRAGVTRLVADVVADTPDESARTGRFADMANMGATMRIVRVAHAQGLIDVRLRCGLPRQTPGMWRRELADALAWEPRQVEVAPLTVERGSRMWEEESTRGSAAGGSAGATGEMGATVGHETSAGATDARELAAVTADVLGGAGYERVAGARGDGARGEVWALPEHASRLAQAAARDVETLGLGVGAASRIDGFAYENTDDLDLYLARSADVAAIVRDVRRVG
ncbi:hypothetical protein I3I95_01630 [bacterium]|nr:hypothetical protein [bacterium]